MYALMVLLLIIGIFVFKIGICWMPGWIKDSG